MPPSGDSARRGPSDSGSERRSGWRGPSAPAETAGISLVAASAREAAFQTLELVRERSFHVAEAWLQVQSGAALATNDRNLSRELAFGVVRREITLDHLLQSVVKRPLEQIEPPLKTILQLGLYQLAFADQIPPHAAVHETVELAKKVGRLRWSGFVNGILRSAGRLFAEEFAESASSRSLPVCSANQHWRFRRLSEPLLPDPEIDFLGYFWRAYGFPEWLAARWVARWPPESLHRLGQWHRAPPPLYLRVNRLRTTRDELIARFREAGLDATPCDLPEAVQVLSGGRIEEWPGYADGLFSVQDLTAMHAARRLAPTSGSQVLDLCAAPGGKAGHLAECMGDSGAVLATDIVPARLTRIVENAQRLGLTSVHALLVGEEGHDLPRGPFDFILADVPCSNTGVIGRRPEVVRHLTLDAIHELSRLQSELLRRAADRLKPGGRLLYSTCSIEAEENEQVVERFLAERGVFRLVEEQLFLPGAPADGGYQALLESRV